MGAEQSSSRPRSNNPTSVPRTRQDTVYQEYTRAQAELREIYEGRPVQQRNVEISTIRPTPQTVQIQANSQNQNPVISTNQTLSNQQLDHLMRTTPTAAAQTIQSAHTVARNQEPQNGSIQKLLNEQPKQMITQPVQDFRAQMTPSGSCFTQSKPVTTSGTNRQDNTTTSQNTVHQEYTRAQAELREIYEGRLVQQRNQEISATRPAHQIAQFQTNSRNQNPVITTNQTLSNQQLDPLMRTTPTAAAQTIQSAHTVARNQAPQTGSIQKLLNEQPKQMVTQPVQAFRTQMTPSGSSFIESKPVTTSGTNTQDNIATSSERIRTLYNYSSAELLNAIQHPKKESIYPNLNREITHRFQGNTPTQGSSRRPEEDFVFINRSDENNRFTPSAPLRDRSISSDRRARSRNNNQKNDNLSCRTCSNTFGLKIYQCPNGHSSCSDCHSRNALCGLCRLNITDMRNIMLEDYISQQKIPCPNAEEGCCLLLKMLDMEIHLKQCPFQEITCPVNGTCGYCNWRGKISQLASHFSEIHPMQTQGKVDTELLLVNICFDNHTLYLVTLGPFNFLFHVKVSEKERKIFMAVQLLGTTISASKWDYEVHVYNKREPRRKYQFTDICTPASTCTDDLFNDSNCATLPLSYAMTFLNEGVLYYKFFIKQNQEAKTDFNKNRRGRGAFRGRHN